MQTTEASRFGMIFIIRVNVNYLRSVLCNKKKYNLQIQPRIAYCKSFLFKIFFFFGTQKTRLFGSIFFLSASSHILHFRHLYKKNIFSEHVETYHKSKKRRRCGFLLLQLLPYKYMKMDSKPIRCIVQGGCIGSCNTKTLKKKPKS